METAGSWAETFQNLGQGSFVLTLILSAVIPAMAESLVSFFGWVLQRGVDV